MTLLQLWKKLQKSGIDDNPVITDKELEVLNDKLKETHEFLDVVNPALLGVDSYQYTIRSMLEARKIK